MDMYGIRASFHMLSGEICVYLLGLEFAATFALPYSSQSIAASSHWPMTT